jgi:hypothetical protein
VVWIRYVYPGSASVSKNLGICNLKTDTKFSKIRSRIFIPDPGSRILDLDFSPPGSRVLILIPDPGVKKHRILDPDLGPQKLGTTNKMTGGGSRFLEKSSGTAVLGPLYICAKIGLFQRTG